MIINIFPNVGLLLGADNIALYTSMLYAIYYMLYTMYLCRHAEVTEDADAGNESPERKKNKPEYASPFTHIRLLSSSLSLARGSHLSAVLGDSWSGTKACQETA